MGTIGVELYLAAPGGGAEGTYGTPLQSSKLSIRKIPGGIEPLGIHPIVLCRRFRRPVLEQGPNIACP